MKINLPIYHRIEINGYQMFPGEADIPGLKHTFRPGLNLVAGVNGLGKSTVLLALYHGIVGQASIRNDDYGVPRPEVVYQRMSDCFRKRVADGARSASLIVKFSIGEDIFEISRSLHDLSLTEWKINGSPRAIEENDYEMVITNAMRVSSFADVLILLNLVVFMFEKRSLLMWTPLAQRNVLRALFMSPEKARILASRAKKVATVNSSYRNLLYIANREKRKLRRVKKTLDTADSLSIEYNTLQDEIAVQVDQLSNLRLERDETDETRTEARSTLEKAKYNYDDLLRELEALKLARVANAFPSATEAGRYVIDGLIGDHSCLICGAMNGPLIAKWKAAISDGGCLICGSPPNTQETVVPLASVDGARIDRVESRLASARDALETAQRDLDESQSQFLSVQSQIDKLLIKRRSNEKRIRQIAGALPPSPPELRALEERVATQDKTLSDLRHEQIQADAKFSEIFSEFQQAIQAAADNIRDRFAVRISQFLLEHAEITFSTTRAPIGESGKSYEWPTFLLNMTSGTFDNPSPRRSRNEVSMSQGEFIDLAFRLALVEVAAGSGPATLVFDAPEASLDALFMRRAGAFLARFAQNHPENRLVVTSNLTNADMIPALFGAYEPMLGDPIPIVISRDERWSRVVDLLKVAVPTTAVQKIGRRYDDLLCIALFPPDGEGRPGL